MHLITWKVCNWRFKWGYFNEPGQVQTVCGAWLFQFLSCSPLTTGLALQFPLVCHNSDDLFKAFIV